MATIKIRCINSNIRGEVKVQAVEPHIRIIITNIQTGYTIQELKGLTYFTSDPAVIVPTYRVNVLEYSIDHPNGKFVFSFNVTRDAWFFLGKKGKTNILLNRAFVPANWKKNLYGALWIPSFPKMTGLGAFILTRFGKRKIPAKPLLTQKKLDGTLIDAYRKEENYANDVMIHVGGTYELPLGYDTLGGSLGCFGFIPEDDIYPSVSAAKEAVEKDLYDDVTSNNEWKKVTNKILKLSFKLNKKIKILLEYRDEKQNYIPDEILEE